MTIHALDVVDVDLPDVRVSVHCSSGTYIRAIARDLGAALGVGGHLTALRRTAVGPFTLDHARTLEELTEHFALTPIADAARTTFPAVDLDESQAADVRVGRRLDLALTEVSALFAPSGSSSRSTGRVRTAAPGPWRSSSDTNRSGRPPGEAPGRGILQSMSSVLWLRRDLRRRDLPALGCGCRRHRRRCARALRDRPRPLGRRRRRPSRLARRKRPRRRRVVRRPPHRARRRPGHEGRGLRRRGRCRLGARQRRDHAVRRTPRPAGARDGSRTATSTGSPPARRTPSGRAG